MRDGRLDQGREVAERNEGPGTGAEKAVEVTVTALAYFQPLSNTDRAFAG